ncbi:MAG: class I SAM-dependent DNA methyltransferase [Alphaproteobacteria bacterium]|nr:class I SAM-dependent DNA methyltransferase [Alphaproteobacteria bacterium]
MDYVMGNPPFIGHQWQTPEQRKEMQACYRHSKKSGRMDYVSAWYCKTMDYIAGGKIKAAFVSTNSLTQGEQVAPLWKELRSRGPAHIHFAHRTFRWANEARGKAAVHCVIIGFGAHEEKTKRLFVYDDIDGEPHEITAQNINPYLVDAPDILVESRSKPISPVAPMVRGSGPVDGGNFLLDEKEKEELIAAEKSAEKWIRPYSMGNDFINGIPRFCLWLKNCPPQELRKMPRVLARVKAVKEMREKSANKETREFAAKPTLFMTDRQSKSDYLAIPQVSSERREYIPIGFLPADHIAGNMLFTVPNATLYEFGVITSLMHMSWMRAVCGRLESRYRYGARSAYNNFPWPQNPTKKQTTEIKTAAQSVLTARATYPDSTLADLYDPLTMPAELLKAHQTLDTATDRAYRPAAFPDEATRVAFLFALYQKYTAPVLPSKKKRARKAR